MTLSATLCQSMNKTSSMAFHQLSEITQLLKTLLGNTQTDQYIDSHCPNEKGEYRANHAFDGVAARSARHRCRPTPGNWRKKQGESSFLRPDYITLDEGGPTSTQH